MSQIVLEILYGFTAAAMGALTALWVCWSHFHGKVEKEVSVKARHASDILARLQELSTRVAIDVDRHNSQVEEINEELTSADKNKPTVIIDVVAKLIQTNQEMQKKLATTEDKLRKQAQKIQIHATEARTDALTLLANRRAFDNELVRRVAEYRRLGRRFSLIMGDVDDFKKFNDTYGHQVGDQVLQGLAKMLRRTMREMDLVARYGGEEYAIILPGTKLDDACKAALRACDTIAKYHLQHEENGDLQVTVSFGVAELQPNEAGIALVSRADKALYASKEGGRNCIHRHDGQFIERVTPNKQAVPDQKKEQPQCEPVIAAQEKNEEAGASPDGKDGGPSPEVISAAEQDVVSAMPSRTNFCQQVRNRLAEKKRGGPDFSIVLVEVDQFNGEKSGGPLSHELATQMVAKYLAANVRDMDVVGHYAPGCFALMLPTAGIVDSIRVAERFREGFFNFIGVNNDEQSRFTLSIGVAQVMDIDETIPLLKRAEEALDTADRQGGNRTYYHDGKRCAPITAMLETMDYLS
jgi:diguanylate cyclase